MILRVLWDRYRRERRGAVTVPASLLMGIFISVIGASVELGYAYYQYNAAQHAARIGVRIAATSDPVAEVLGTMTGMEGGAEAGDPMPDYNIACNGATQSCSTGRFDRTAFERVYFGKDNDGICGPTNRERRGMCDMASHLTSANVTISYRNSGFGTAGNPADVLPLISVTLSDLRFNFLFLDMITGDTFTSMPDVTVTAMSEDLKTGS